MKKIYLSVLVVFLPVSLFAQVTLGKKIQPQTYTLLDCYQFAISSSENLLIKDEGLKAAEAQYKVALAGLYPQLSYNISQTVRDNPNFGRINRSQRNLDDPSTPVGGTAGILGRSQVAGTITLTQPLFNGFRNFLLSDAAKKQIEMIKHENNRARDLLYLDVADLFFQIIYGEKDLKILTQSKNTLSSRITELQEFIKLGKSRESEVVAVQADLSDLETTRQQTVGLIKASKELLSFLIAKPAQDLKLNATLEQQKLRELSTYVEISQNRSDIKAKKLSVDAEKLKVKASNRARWPTIDLTANSYTFDDPDRTRDWDVFVQLSLPIFDWGKIKSQQELAESQLRIAKLQTEQNIRLAERDVKVAYVNAVTANEQIKSLEKLKVGNKKNYDLQVTDYKNGVVTNLEVLQAIRQTQDAERRLLSAQRLYFTNLIELQVAAGELIK